ncbi:MAG: insulinase family protein [Crocinitomicaceae bacterium]|nr:insulinase family protein [Crocinitomicaceae bacterium]
MIQYEKFKLDNGLRVLFHKDDTTPMAAVNVLYDVGARDENPDKTGFAHLFEHLMFGGSANIPDYDAPLQNAGGDNNAFTNNDITNYYDIVPASNLETALWLESDRMNQLAFTPKSLEVQRSVVIEEFKQRYLNQPYGDVWLQLRPLAYKKHPYKWPTIGKEISHIENATLEDVKAFFYKHYGPQNAILSIAGNFELDYIKEKVNHWFGDIPAREKYERNIVAEPDQFEMRTKHIDREVPADSFYFAYKMPDRLHPDYYTADLISDILGRGKSSRLYDTLLKNMNLVSEISAYITGSFDTGLLVISGKATKKNTFDRIEEEIENILDAIRTNEISEDELVKVKNKLETSKVFSDMGVHSKALNLGYFELLGDPDLVNTELKQYEKVTTKDIMKFAKLNLVNQKCSKLFVHSKN